MLLKCHKTTNFEFVKLIECLLAIFFIYYLFILFFLEGCVHVPAEKHLLTVGSNTYLEFSLNNTCNSPNEFNRTLMELKCDPIKDNDHYEPPSINNCILTYKLMTHLTCTEKVCFWIQIIVHQ